MEDRDPPRQGLRRPLDQRKALGPREEPPARAAVLVDRHLEVREELRDVLHLVQDHRRRMVVEEAHRVGQGPLPNVGRLQGDVVVRVPEVGAQERGLPRLARTRHEHRREARHRPRERSRESTVLVVRQPSFDASWRPFTPVAALLLLDVGTATPASERLASDANSSPDTLSIEG